MLDTFDHSDFSAAGLSGRLPGSVSVVIPTRNCAATIADTVRAIVPLTEAGLVGQILVVDADSPDDTAGIARAAGAEAVSENDLMPEFGRASGKGDAMWRALSAVTGEVVVYVDGDISGFGTHYITGLVGPLADGSHQFTNGRYRRPFRQGETETPTGGGRVTELTARPLLARLAPELAAFDQPLAGEIAATRDLLFAIPFLTGYGVEIAMLVDVWDRIGLDGMAEVDLGVKRNAHQPLSGLRRMADEVLAGLADALDRTGRKDTGRIQPVGQTGPALEVRPPLDSLGPAAD